MTRDRGRYAVLIVMIMMVIIPYKVIYAQNPIETPTVDVPADSMTILRGEDYMLHLLDSVKKAKQRIWIATYSITGPRSNRMTYFYKKLENKYDSGVDVKLLITGKLDRNKKIIQKLRKKFDFDMKLYEGDNLFHGKFIVIDQNKVYNGSANLTLTAFNRPYETSIFVEDQSLTRTFAHLMKRVWNKEDN
ncbi:MAG: phosphatidylserine/phosphatidylglycerophosphate/cardiolipin synthase family protein [bacterium]